MYGRGRGQNSFTSVRGRGGGGRGRSRGRGHGHGQPPQHGGRRCQSLADVSEPRRTRDSSTNTFLDVADIVKILCETPQHLAPAEDIIDKLKSNMRALDCVSDKFSHILHTSSSGNKSIIELKPQVKLCQEYIKSSGCTSPTHCKKLHICHEFTYESCPDYDCDYGHRWSTTHNHDVWTYFFLGDVDELVLQSIMKKHFKRLTGIAVCKPYNEHCCPNVLECKNLHICQKLIDESSECDTTMCLLNHDILTRHCAKLLIKAGISIHDSRRDVLSNVRNTVSQVRGVHARHEKAKAELVDCFEDLCEQEEKVREIVSCFLTLPNFYCHIEYLSEKVHVAIDRLKKLVNQYYFLFIIYVRSNNECLVKLQPRLALCHFYSASQECRNGESCGYLHLCTDFLRGVCEDNDDCNAIHSLTDHPNDIHLKKHFLDGIPLGLVLSYMKVRFCYNSAPFVCFPYNEGKCMIKGCKNLHVCYDYLFTQRPCSDRCSKNHNFYSDKNLPLLVQDGLDDLPPHKLLSLLSARVSHWPKRTKPKGVFTTHRRC
ncbi:Zinc finger CCCH-type [Trinorchestia longiramus]|nr:Zinc finger CCCH-type [Trinorchestia longiramus]